MYQLKRGNESESGESIKAEIGIVHATVGDNKFSALPLHGMGLDLRSGPTWLQLITSLPPSAISHDPETTKLCFFFYVKIVFSFFFTLTHFFELRAMEGEELEQNQRNANGVDLTKNK